MNRFVFYLVFPLILLLITGTIFVKDVSQEEVISTESVLENNTIENTLEIYWTASLSGNAALVAEISELPPSDFLQDCIGRSEVDEGNLNSNYRLPLNETKNDENTIENLISSKPDEVSNPFVTENIPGSIRATSEYIYFTKISAQRVKIEIKKAYQDEAIAEVSTANNVEGMTSSSTMLFFFKKSGQRWKIISIVDKSSLFSISEKVNYAIPRPLCK